ncbi:MAG: hypothetical protein HY749_16205 [Gammaproteobacteria bacterium]|nr:hypothetical protein [Gammaproteobacteria bacterium]
MNKHPAACPVCSNEDPALMLYIEPCKAYYDLSEILWCDEPHPGANRKPKVLIDADSCVYEGDASGATLKCSACGHEWPFPAVSTEMV